MSIENLPSEIWKAIPGYEGLYEVSNLGRVKSLERLAPLPRGRGTRVIKESLMLQKIKRGGYLCINLCAGGIKKYHFVHRLVLGAFVGVQPTGYQACHADGNRLNNLPDNLRWDTPKNNSADKFTHGTVARGERINRSLLTEANIIEIRRRYAMGNTSQQSIADDFGVSQPLVGCIVRRAIWKHI